MSGVEFTDDTTEDLPEPRRRSVGRVTVAGVTLAAAAITIGVGLTHDHGSEHHRAALIVTPSTAPTLIAPGPSTVVVPFQPADDASDVLSYTGVFTESGSLGSGDLTYDFVVVNVSAKDVRITYPITIASPDSTDVPVVFAGFYDEAIAQKHINDSTTPAHRLTTIPATQPASLLIRMHVDCVDLGPSATSTDQQPVVQVHIAGFTAPARFAFSQVANGFDDAVRQMCGV